MERYVCIHGHFYQPPRENPWLEEVEVQDSAYPYHDWNARITAECYAPNAAARILDGDGKIVNSVNNYATISSNIGPTLLSWLQEKKPDVYKSILDADKLSQTRYGGHGAALAQAYNHMILPLANDRDRYTQVLWGIRDFEHRFGRRPEGMWLPETAVDLKTLEVLASLGIRFTILSPYQAGRVRYAGHNDWQDATGGKIDPATAYTQKLPSGKTIALFFYDGPIARGVAFEGLLTRGENLANRLLGAFSDGRPWPQLIHIATDGESYGHHHAHGDMALAYALQVMGQQPEVKLTIYGEFLDRHPPQHEVEIVENTSWSCFHGVERWQSNCGCNSGRPVWHQSWRGPLREALDWLRDSVAPLFEARGKEFLRDPWAARNDYIQIILDRSPERVQRFLLEHANRELTAADSITLLKLLELQRHAQLMYTSCGWFFDEISGIETVQVIAYAGRVIQLSEELFGQPLEEAFLERLEKAKSNVPEHRDGRAIYRKWVKPSVVGWNQIAAHYAVSSLWEAYADTARIYCYAAERQDFHSLSAGKARLVVGRAKVTSEITHETAERSFGMIHFGDYIVNGGVRRFEDEAEYHRLRQELTQAFERADFPQILRLLDRGFGETTYSLKSLFRDEQRKVVEQVLQSRRAEAEAAYRKLYEDNLPTMRFLADIAIPLPQALRVAAEFIIRNDLHWALRDDDPDLQAIRTLLDEAARWRVQLDAAGLDFQLKVTLARMADRFRAQPADLPTLLSLEQVVNLALAMPFEVDLWAPQNVYFHLLQTIVPELEQRARGDADSQAWLQHFLGLGERLRIQVGDLKKKIAELQKVPTLTKVLDEIFTRPRIPAATYRLQFNKEFSFSQAREVVPYLFDLGVSDLYASPILQACPGSLHGYDVCDHSRLNDELGGRSEFDAFAAALSRQQMGLLLDMVPNHMGIGHPSNRWWMDVLENGPSSVFASYFDIAWHPANPNLENKILLPVLGDQYGAVLESGHIKLNYEDGGCFVAYYNRRFAIAPCTYALILEYKLEALTEALGEANPHLQELRSILTALRHLPGRTETASDLMAERAREKEVIKRRIAALVQNSPEVRTALDATLQAYKGRQGEPATFDLLDRLLESQVFRLAYWRVATEEINYRRFFDVNELAAIRVELPEVFQATHQLYLELLAEGKATGLRIDHPDGLWNPTSYFRQLQEAYVRERAQRRLGVERTPEGLTEEVEQRLNAQVNGSLTPGWPLFVAAEKILAESEPLPRDWAVHGTTGYDTLNLINCLFVAAANEPVFTEIYTRFIGRGTDFYLVIQANKRMIMLVSLASEISALSHRLDRISERNRRYRDFTLGSLTFAVREIIAALPIYRTYISSPETVSLRDRMYIESAVEEARRLNPRTAPAIFHFIRDTLLLRNLGDFRAEDQPEVIDWVMRFQQLTGPVMAKGLEDTSFYTYNRLTSLNEVGGHPQSFGITLDHFHQQNAERRQRWPHSMTATATHDTKRGEDTRARLNVLSELPEEWRGALDRWSRLNVEKKTPLEKLLAPAVNDEYLLYQTLLGAWPAEQPKPEQLPAFCDRIANYMQKATREAKVYTSWISPNEGYDQAVRDFVHRLLPDNPDDDFRKDFQSFQARVAFFGCFNSLSQVLLKITLPGVPDFYQGTELWDFSLVDPDNRRPVDYGLRRALLTDLRNRLSQAGHNLLVLTEELLSHLPDGRIKLYVTHRGLSFRRANRALFDDGDYIPLRAVGDNGQHLCAFLRLTEEQGIIVAAPRLMAILTGGITRPPLGPEVWKDTWILLPYERVGKALQNLFTDEAVPVREHNGSPAVAAADVFAHFPVFLGMRVMK
jgi:(1->4)-alpha-D-glucan 1-alpha-D-glucosylmutase